jgi:hypothetical protein
MAMTNAAIVVETANRATALEFTLPFLDVAVPCL